MINPKVTEARKIRQLRLQVIAHLGGSCVKCSFSDWRALQVDHVLGGGTAEYKALGGTKNVWRAAMKDTTGKYQLLCANCNWIKRYTNNECALGQRFILAEDRNS